MFQSLVEKMSNAFSKFRNKGKLTEADVKAGMREIKLALLDAHKMAETINKNADLV